MKTFEEFRTEALDKAGLIYEDDNTFEPSEVDDILRGVVEEYKLDVILYESVALSSDVTAVQWDSTGGVCLTSDEVDKPGEIVLYNYEITRLVEWLYENDMGEYVDAGLPDCEDDPEPGDPDWTEDYNDPCSGDGDDDLDDDYTYPGDGYND